MSDLDVATFEIADMFSGKAYPKEVVEVYTDDATAYEIHKLSERALAAVQTRDESEAKAVEAELQKLYKKGLSSRYEIHLTGVSRDLRGAVIAKVREEYPSEVDFLGREKPNAEADDDYANRIWALYIEKLVAPNGAVKVAPEIADAKILRGNLADSEIAKIEAGIRELSEGAKSGFEALAQEHDFLSSASPEA